MKNLLILFLLALSLSAFGSTACVVEEPTHEFVNLAPADNHADYVLQVPVASYCFDTVITYQVHDHVATFAIDAPNTPVTSAWIAHANWLNCNISKDYSYLSKSQPIPDKHLSPLVPVYRHEDGTSPMLC